MSFLRPEIALRIFDTPLLMHRGKAEAALLAIGGRIVDGGIQFTHDVDPIDHAPNPEQRPSMGRIGDRLGRAFDQRGMMPFDLIEGVAVIPIEGTLVHKGAYVGMSSGRTSYEGIQTQVARARRQPEVRGVVLEVDSFGGEAAGAFETADQIAALSVEKPTIAILTDNALSAGYLLASAARQIVMPELGRAGSIGVVTLHTDVSGALEKAGVKVTILTAGKHKADGNSFEPLPDEVRARILDDLERGRQNFASAVGRYRGRRFTAEQALATEADDFRGEDAVRLGLVDAVGHGSAAFNEFVSVVNRARRP